MTESQINSFANLLGPSIETVADSVQLLGRPGRISYTVLGLVDDLLFGLHIALRQGIPLARAPFERRLRAGDLLITPQELQKTVLVPVRPPDQGCSQRDQEFKMTLEKILQRHRELGHDPLHELSALDVVGAIQCGTVLHEKELPGCLAIWRGQTHVQSISHQRLKHLGREVSEQFPPVALNADGLYEFTQFDQIGLRYSLVDADGEKDVDAGHGVDVFALFGPSQRKIPGDYEHA